MFLDDSDAGELVIANEVEFHVKHIANFSESSILTHYSCSLTVYQDRRPEFLSLEYLMNATNISVAIRINSFADFEQRLAKTIVGNACSEIHQVFGEMSDWGNFNELLPQPGLIEHWVYSSSSDRFALANIDDFFLVAIFASALEMFRTTLARQ